MSRNSDRLSPIPEQQNEREEIKPFSFDFPVPTELVELPSRGDFYPEGHPLCGKDSIEIRFMTAKHEDILTNKSYIRSGQVIDRLLDSLILDKKINHNELLVGDRNALIIAARISGYTAEYKTDITCPVCSRKTEQAFNLEDKDINYGNDYGDFDISRSVNALDIFEVTLPVTKVKVEFRLLKHSDAVWLSQREEKLSEKNLPSQASTSQLKKIIVSIQGVTEQRQINMFVDEHMPAKDSLYLRNAFNQVNPSVALRQIFRCGNDACGHVEPIDVPLNREFFWPKR